MVVDALLRAAYTSRPARAPADPYELPENLRRFYEATARSQGEACCADPNTCCAEPPAGAAPVQEAVTPCCSAPETCCSPKKR